MGETVEAYISRYRRGDLPLNRMNMMADVQAWADAHRAHLEHIVSLPAATNWGVLSRCFVAFMVDTENLLHWVPRPIRPAVALFVGVALVPGYGLVVWTTPESAD